MRVISLAIVWLILCAAIPFPIGAPPPMPAPMCSVIAGGCAEAWGMSEAAVHGYSGPLFQLYNGSTTLDIGQVGGGNFKADMTTWSAFCGGMNTTANGITTNSVCKVSKIYAELHGSANDVIPSVFLGSGVNCTPGGNFCACPFRMEAATGLPILYKVNEMCEYTLASDQAATGVNSGSNPMSLIYNGLPNPTSAMTQCCGGFGLTHAYNAGDTPGTDFTLFTASISANCGVSPFQCYGLDEEGGNNGATVTTSWAGQPVIIVVNHDTVGNLVNGWINGYHSFSAAPGVTPLAPGTSVHIGGGGDLSQPADIAIREMAVTNTAMTQTDVNAVFSQTKINYLGLLTFPNLM